jgi:hypothetical protein
MENTFNCGWLSPNARFYPCEFTEHKNLAKEIIDKENSERELEDSGWVKICYDTVFNTRPLTCKQKDWLLDRVTEDPKSERSETIKMIIDEDLIWDWY